MLINDEKCKFLLVKSVNFIKDVLICSLIFGHVLLRFLPTSAILILPADCERSEQSDAAKFAELLGEVVTDSTKKNLEMRVEAEYGATAGKTDLAKRAKELGLDAIHDTVHEMARDEARHGKALKGLLERYFK